MAKIKTKKLNRYEKTAQYNAKVASALSGTGVYLFKNNSKADIMLSKPTNEGYKVVSPGQEFRGDSYFKKLVGQGLTFLRDETPIVVDEGKIMAQEKLILDQPDQVTTQGKIEQVVKSQVPQKLNETRPGEENKQQDVLIAEDPLAGVEIVLND
jgi:hypothetical protein